MDCAHPSVVKTDNGYIEVPCGSCILCRIARTREWSTRLQFENSCWNESVFVTLTYDDEHLPVSNCGVPTLVKSDLQKFFKRLRSSIDGKCKYFACGEYGDHTERSHYHAIIFGLSPSDLGLFQSCWPLGFVSVGGVSPQSIQYVTGYVRKKLVKKSASPDDFCCLHRLPEFQIQSQGLGLRFYERFRSVFRSNASCYINGHRESLPRYFLKKDPGLKMALRFSNEKYDPRSENLRRAQEVIESRQLDLDLLSEMRRSALQDELTEYSKNALFKKGSI